MKSLAINKYYPYLDLILKYYRLPKRYGTVWHEQTPYFNPISYGYGRHIVQFICEHQEVIIWFKTFI